jgi:putative oxidoreductase
MGGECGMCDARRLRGGDVVDLDTTVAILRVFAGLLIAGHGAQKWFGWSGGQGMAGFTEMVQRMGTRPARAWARVGATAELGGGLLLAVGFLTGIAAGLLVLDMVVAAWRVHWPRGLWIANGGYEYALTNSVVFGLFGLAGPGAYSLDAALGLVSWTVLLFLTTLVVGMTAVWAGTRPAAIERIEEERRRRVA